MVCQSWVTWCYSKKKWEHWVRRGGWFPKEFKILRERGRERGRERERKEEGTQREREMQGEGEREKEKTKCLLQSGLSSVDTLKVWTYLIVMENHWGFLKVEGKYDPVDFWLFNFENNIHVVLFSLS